MVTATQTRVRSVLRLPRVVVPTRSVNCARAAGVTLPVITVSPPPPHSLPPSLPSPPLCPESIYRRRAAALHPFGVGGKNDDDLPAVAAAYLFIHDRKQSRVQVSVDPELARAGVASKREMHLRDRVGRERGA